MKFIWTFFICVFVANCAVSQGARITLFEKPETLDETAGDFERLAKRRLVDVSRCQMGSSVHNCWPRQCATTNAMQTKFKRPFENTPTVIVGFGKLDVDNGANLRVTSDALYLTKVGFTLRFATWANTKVWAYKLVWIACD